MLPLTYKISVDILKINIYIVIGLPLSGKDYRVTIFFRFHLAIEERVGDKIIITVLCSPTIRRCIWVTKTAIATAISAEIRVTVSQSRAGVIALFWRRGVWPSVAQSKSESATFISIKRISVSFYYSPWKLVRQK